MSWIHAVILGVLQGLTEFLPVSSSGHLALAQMMLPGFHQPGVVFDAVLHLGTASAVVWYERKSLADWLRSKAGRRLLVLVVLGTVATGALAFPLRGVAEHAFGKAIVVGALLIVTGLIVAGTRLLPGGEADEGSISWRQVVVIGLTQGLAVLPGLSRSGATIAAGLGAGLDRAWAARFSFLLSVPAILGVTVLEVYGQRAQITAAGPSFWFACAVGAVAAATAGYLALRIVVHTLSSRVFHRFAWYVLPLGALVVAISLGVT